LAFPYIRSVAAEYFKVSRWPIWRNTQIKIAYEDKILKNPRHKRNVEYYFKKLAKFYFKKHPIQESNPIGARVFPCLPPEFWVALCELYCDNAYTGLLQKVAKKLPFTWEELYSGTHYVRDKKSYLLETADRQKVLEKKREIFRNTYYWYSELYSEKFGNPSKQPRLDDTVSTKKTM
jgi:hypothetical protein